MSKRAQDIRHLRKKSGAEKNKIGWLVVQKLVYLIPLLIIPLVSIILEITDMT
jgi:predicted Kef-type K+ transport protein